MAGIEALVAVSMALAHQKTGGTVKWRMTESSKNRARLVVGSR